MKLFLKLWVWICCSLQMSYLLENRTFTYEVSVEQRCFLKCSFMRHAKIIHSWWCTQPLNCVFLVQKESICRWMHSTELKRSSQIESWEFLTIFTTKQFSETLYTCTCSILFCNNHLPHAPLGDFTTAHTLWCQLHIIQPHITQTRHNAIQLVAHMFKVTISTTSKYSPTTYCGSGHWKQEVTTENNMISNRQKVFVFNAV